MATQPMRRSEYHNTGPLRALRVAAAKTAVKPASSVK